jgi:hypothetical protein
MGLNPRNCHMCDGGFETTHRHALIGMVTRRSPLDKVSIPCPSWEEYARRFMGSVVVFPEEDENMLARDAEAGRRIQSFRVFTLCSPLRRQRFERDGRCRRCCAHSVVRVGEPGGGYSPPPRPPSLNLSLETRRLLSIQHVETYNSVGLITITSRFKQTNAVSVARRFATWDSIVRLL